MYRLTTIVRIFIVVNYNRWKNVDPLGLDDDMLAMQVPSTSIGIGSFCIPTASL